MATNDPPPDLRRLKIRPCWTQSHSPKTRRAPSHCSTTVMQQTSAAASAGEPSAGRYVVRLSGALAALLGRGQGAELWEDEILGMMREHGLLTYPSPLLGGLLEKVPEVLEKEVLARLDATDHAMIAQMARPWRAAVWPGRIQRIGIPFLFNKREGSKCLAMTWRATTARP